MKKSEFILLVGNIASGKSTISKEYANKGYIVISRDSLRYMIGANQYIYNKSFEPFIKKSALSILKIFLKSGYNIVYDETNVSKRLRKASIQIAKKHNYKIISVLLPKITKRESVKRRLKNPHGQFSKTVWENAWENFNAIYEEPTKSEDIDRIVRLK